MGPIELQMKQAAKNRKDRFLSLSPPTQIISIRSFERSIALPIRRIFSDNLFKAREILRQVCEKHNVTVADIKSHRRAGGITEARREAMWRMRNETPYSFPQIGRLVGGKDHSTVVYGVKKYDDEMRRAGKL